MLTNKRFHLVLSLIIAICLWAYVIGETNPKDTRTLRDIPIALLNEQALEDNDLAILSVSAVSVNVTLTGNRADVNHVSVKDISASVNLADAAEGENQLRINLRVPDKVEIADTNISRVSVIVEPRVSKEVPIEVSYEGDFAPDEEAVTVDMDRESVVVVGAASLIEQVHHAEASVVSGQVSEQLKTFRCRLVPVTVEGEEISNVNLSAGEVQVSAQLVMAKTVSLSVPIRDDSAQLVEKTTSVPKTVVIKGKPSILKNVESITTEEVDLSDVTEDTTIPLTPILPEGVQISSQSQTKLVMKVKAIPLVSKTFAFTEKDIQLDGLADDTLTAKITAVEIEIRVWGHEENLSALEKDDFVLAAHLDGLGAGKHRIDVEAECKGDCASLEVTPQTIQVTVKAKTDENNKKPGADADAPSSPEAEDNGDDESTTGNADSADVSADTDETEPAA